MSEKMKDKNISPFESAKKARDHLLGETVVKALSQKGFHAQYTDTAEEALDQVLSLIPQNSSVGIPGSVTIRELGIMEKLEERGNRIFHHWDPSLTPETKGTRLSEENNSDFILTSSNALTLDGMLVNIDGVGNRVSAMAWGNNTIIYVIGINKIANDLESAIQRVRDQATPPNAIRLKIDTPCSHTGHCMNCNSPQRVCRALLILERAPMGRDCHVILVGENLGY
jgi:L-lactate utilization protein LutB